MRRAALILRAAALLLVVAAPFAPRAHREGDQRSVIYVADGSDSISDSERAREKRFVDDALALRGRTQVGLITFGSRPDLVLPVGADPAGRKHSGPYAPPPGTDIAAAVRLASAALPDGGERRIVLITDGHATADGSRALAEVRTARRRGILTDVVPLGESVVTTPVLSAIGTVRSHVSEGEPVEAVARVRGVPRTEVPVVWSRDGAQVQTTSVTLDARGEGEARLDDPEASSGVHVYQAWLGEAPYDSARTVAIVSGKPRVLVLGTDGERPTLLADALERAGADLRVSALAAAQIDRAALSELDLVVLADLPIARAGEVTLLAGLDEESQEALIEFVQRGGGVLVTGGTYGFAPEWALAPIARMLPVQIEDQGEIEDPRLAMAIMLDRSGSMGAYVGSHTKMELAVEAALAAAVTLEADDLVAIASIDTVTTWNQPLGPASQLPARQQTIRAIDSGGGGIYVYTALADAYAALRGTSTPIRHVLLFSDTADSEEQWQGCPFSPCRDRSNSALTLAAAARDAGITTSVVGIGNERDQDTQFLRDLAATSGGRFYLTSRATDLRKIFISETRAAARSNVRAEPVRIAQASDHPLLAGIDVAALPPITGFVQTGRRATADTTLVTPDGTPVLASWRYGLGQVVALTTEAGGEWTAGWARSEMAGQLMRQIARFAMRRKAASDAEARVAVRDGSVEVTIDVADEDADAPASIDLCAIGSESGSCKPVAAELERVRPGRWVARGRTAGEPFVLARVFGGSGSSIAEAVGETEAAAERRGVGPDTRVLAELARAGTGLYDPSPAATLRSDGPLGAEPVATWPYLLVAAAALVGLDLWLRRLRVARLPAAEPKAAQLPLSSAPARAA